MREAATTEGNLGLELLEKRGADARIDHEPGLIRPFLVGWQALGRIPDRVVEALTQSLARLQASTGGKPDRAAPQSRQGIAGQAERPQWIQSLADLRSIGEAFRKLPRRRPPPPV